MASTDGGAVPASTPRGNGLRMRNMFGETLEDFEKVMRQVEQKMQLAVEAHRREINSVKEQLRKAGGRTSVDSTMTGGGRSSISLSAMSGGSAALWDGALAGERKDALNPILSLKSLRTNHTLSSTAARTLSMAAESSLVNAKCSDGSKKGDSCQSPAPGSPKASKAKQLQQCWQSTPLAALEPKRRVLRKSQSTECCSSLPLQGVLPAPETKDQGEEAVVPYRSEPANAKSAGGGVLGPADLPGRMGPTPSSSSETWQAGVMEQVSETCHAENSGPQRVSAVTECMPRNQSLCQGEASMSSVPFYASSARQSLAFYDERRRVTIDSGDGKLSVFTRGSKEVRATESWKESSVLPVWDLENPSLCTDGPAYNLEDMPVERSGSMMSSDISILPRRRCIRNIFKCQVIHPQSLPRLLFDIIALSVMVYDIIMIPVYITFEPEGDEVLNLLEWGTVFFWITDVILSFNTGYNTSDGSLVMNRPMVVMNYLKTWFGVDLCVLAPDLLVMFDRGAATQAVGAVKAMHAMRFVRVLRLLRLMKVDKILRDLKARINSNSFLLGLAILRHIFCLSLLIHIVACIWYGIGARQNGWVWTHGLADEPLWHGYLTSLHWSLTQFHGSTNINPTNELERLLAVLVLLMALILFSSFLSSITNLMMQLSSLRQERTAHLQALYCFLEDHSISSELSVRVKKYVEAKATSQQKEHDVEFLRLLPKNLMLDLHDEARSPVLTNNPFMAQLRDKHARVVRQICHEAVGQACFQREDLIFAKGDCTQRMYFVECGTARYYLGGRPRLRRDAGRAATDSLSSPGGEVPHLPWQVVLKQTLVSSVSQKLFSGDNALPLTPESSLDARSQNVGRGHWISEAALWTRWEHKGDLEAMCSSSVLMLSVQEFQRVVEAYEVARVECVLYARAFVEALSHFSTLSDMMNFKVTRRSRDRRT